MEQISLNIGHYLRVSKGKLVKDSNSILPEGIRTADGPEALYRHMQYAYPKFFKMDGLCKWAWLAAEQLLSADAAMVYDDIDKNNVAVVLGTSHGCIDVDRKYHETMNSIPSPALFVYTLPNIMLGELCIRHGFKGEQACLLNDNFNSEELYFWVKDLLLNRGMEACLAGWVDVAGDECDICLFWVTKRTEGIIFSGSGMQYLYDN